MSIPLLILLTAALSFLLGWPVSRIMARMGVVDNPNERSSHSTPVVRGGGIAIMASFAFAGLWLVDFGAPHAVAVLVLSSMGIAAISFFDDLRPLAPIARFACHAAASVLVLWALGLSGIAIALAPGPGLLLPVLLSWCLGLIWIAGYTNAFNFMDGINGLAAGQASITALGTAIVGGLALGDFTSAPVLCGLAIAGAAAGFFPHNFPKARMFMGDVGSAPLGFLLAVLVLWVAKAAGWWLLIPLALLHANFVLDTGITLVRRVGRHERWYEPHREHFYQRLIRSGKSHAFVTGIEMVLQVLVLTLMVAYLYAPASLKFVLVCEVVAIWLAFFAFCEVAFRLSQQSIALKVKLQAEAAI